MVLSLLFCNVHNNKHQHSRRNITANSARERGFVQLQVCQKFASLTLISICGLFTPVARGKIWKWGIKALAVLEHDTSTPPFQLWAALSEGTVALAKAPPDVLPLQGLMAGPPMRISKLSLESLWQMELHFQRQVTKFAVRFVSHAQSGHWWICCPWKQKAKMSSTVALDTLGYRTGLRPV